MTIFSSMQLIGLSKSLVTLTWKGNNCSTVEISGLDIGWGQVIILLIKSENFLRELLSSITSTDCVF